jgi:drug/metabolite transporter (DMT)-like permease
MLWLKEEALTPNKLAGMAMGVIGLVLVFQGGLVAGSAAGLTALFLAVVAQSLGLVWLKRINDDSPPLATTLGILVVALPLFFAAWWVVDGLSRREPWPPRYTLALLVQCWALHFTTTSSSTWRRDASRLSR